MKPNNQSSHYILYYDELIPSQLSFSCLDILFKLNLENISIHKNYSHKILETLNQMLSIDNQPMEENLKGSAAEMLFTYK
jgi:hypothetical protein